MKTFTLILRIFNISICTIFLSCFGETSFKKAMYLYENNKVYFNDNIQLFNSIKNLHSIRRYEEKFPWTLFLKSNGWLTYSIKLNDSMRGADIFIDKPFKDKEDLFWKNEFDSIKTNSGINFSEFLKLSNMSTETFLKLKDFMSQNYIFFFTKLYYSDLIIIYLSQVDGFIFNPSNEYPKFSEAKKIKKIDDHIYYFSEK